MDKNSFDRERYRLGHTLVFFRAGALGFLEELRLATISLISSLCTICVKQILTPPSLRDELVIKWVRKIQGEVLKRVRGKVTNLFVKINDKKILASSDCVICSRFMRRRGIREN